MKKRFGKLAMLLLLVGGMALAVMAGAAQANDSSTDGYLFNGGFEGNFYPVGDGQVAEGWVRVNLDGNPDWMSTCAFAEAGPNCDQGWVERIEGENSHILFSEELGAGQPFETVLYQQVSGLTPGKSYSFSGWVLKMWGGPANQFPPTDPYAYGSWIGIDPTGGTDPEAASVLWGEIEWQEEAHGHFENHRLAAVAQDETVTVFVRVWHKWQKAGTQAIVDGLELFDAPTATLHTPAGPLAEPYLDWSGTLPQSLRERGAFELFFEVQKRDGERWVTLVDDLTDDRVPLPLVEGETVQLRVVPYSEQVDDPGRFTWPPSTHVGIPTAAITVTYDTAAPTEPQPPLHYLFLPIIPR
ncbi:MAG: hypothetical protein M3220_08675 [Chloroflexota bacterium]|nr:hypothetical protein [Chloroflexota bacterium]